MSSEKKKTRVLITDAEQGRCYTTARSLAQRGFKVTVAGQVGQKNIAFYSKYCNNRILYPSPEENEEAFIEIMARAAKNQHILIPLHERTIIPLSRHLNRFGNITRIPIPRYSVLKIALDKAKTLRVAQQVGVPTPHTHFVNELEQLDLLSKDLNYPVVIKLRKEICVPPPRYTYAYSRKDFVTKYLLMHRKCKYPLVQELILGTGYGFFSLFNEDSEPLAFFCHKRIREYPITGGPSTYCTSIYNPKIIDYGLKILREIKWYGVAMVEFRKDCRDGEFKLMEINPRFWGSLPLAIASGVDFPYLLCRMVIGENVELNKYETGIKCRFLMRDLSALIQALKETNRKVSYLKAFLKSFFDKNVLYGDISLKNFGPTAYTLFSFIKQVMS